MATAQQKQAARKNLERAREVQHERAQGKRVPKKSPGMSSAEENRLSDSEFAFPDERKEPLSDDGRQEVRRRGVGHRLARARQWWQGLDALDDRPCFSLSLPPARRHR